MKKWQYNGSDFDESSAESYHGFLYEIRISTGHFYIGRRKFYKGWQAYIGRGNVKQFLSENPDAKIIQRNILKLFKSGGALARAEDRAIEKHIKGDGVLVTDMFCLNEQLTHGTFNATGIKRSERTKEKIRKTLTGRKHSEETKRKISKAKKGSKYPPRTKEHTFKLSIARSKELTVSRFGKETTYHSLNSACRLLNVPRTTMLHIIRQKRHSKKYSIDYARYKNE